MPSGDVVIGEHAPTRSLTVPVALVLTGLLESAGQVLRAFGLAVAPAWIVGVVNPLGPVIVITAGVLFFGEHLGRSQWLGVALVGVGIVLLATA